MRPVPDETDSLPVIRRRPGPDTVSRRRVIGSCFRTTSVPAATKVWPAIVFAGCYPNVQRRIVEAALLVSDSLVV